MHPTPSAYGPPVEARPGRPVALMEEVFEKDVRQSEAIHAEEWKKRSIALRLKEWTARLWEYWL